MNGISFYSDQRHVSANTHIACLVILDFLHLLVRSTRSILFYILLSDWAGYKISSAFRGHNTWA